MKYVALICLAVIFLIPSLLLAQKPVTVEVSGYAGVPLRQPLQSNICCSTAFFVHHDIDNTSYTAGFSAGLVLYDRVRVEFGGVYSPIAFTRVQSTGGTPRAISQTTHGTVWEFPLLADYRWLHGRVRPFSGGGLVVYNRTSGGRNQSPAPVINGGVEWGFGRFAIRPELRYIHYPEGPGQSQDVGRPKTQLQLLIGFTVRR